jgi:flagellar hook assembly protein FlgD
MNHFLLFLILLKWCIMKNRIVNIIQNASERSLVWDATNEKNNSVSSGIYFYRLETNKMSLQKKMVLVR